MLIIVVNFFQMCPELLDEIFDDAGDHAGEMETSFLLHVCPQWVNIAQAGEGRRIPFAVPGLNQPGVWTPRPGPTRTLTPAQAIRAATAEKGKRYVRVISDRIAGLLVSLSNAKKGQLPYL